MLRLKGIHLGRALRGVDLDVATGSSVAVTGRNGAGKSTLLAVMAGVLPPARGRVERGLVLEDRLLAHPALSAPPAVSYLPEQRLAGELSMGQRVRLGLYLALGRATGAWVLDDPFLGLDAAGRAAALRCIAARQGEGTVVFATHDAGAIERLASHLVVRVDGRVRVADELESWRSRWRALRVQGVVPGQLPGLRVRDRRLGTADTVEDLVIEDLDGAAAERLRAAGVRVQDAPLSLSEALALEVR